MSDSLRAHGTVAYQAPQFMEFSRQEYWSGLPLPSPGDLPHSGIKSRSPALQADALPSEPPGKPKLSATLKLTEMHLQNPPEMLSNTKWIDPLLEQQKHLGIFF